AARDLTPRRGRRSAARDAPLTSRPSTTNGQLPPRLRGARPRDPPGDPRVARCYVARREARAMGEVTVQESWETLEDELGDAMETLREAEDLSDYLRAHKELIAALET